MTEFSRSSQMSHESSITIDAVANQRKNQKNVESSYIQRKRGSGLFLAEQIILKVKSHKSEIQELNSK